MVDFKFGILKACNTPKDALSSTNRACQTLRRFRFKFFRSQLCLRSMSRVSIFQIGDDISQNCYSLYYFMRKNGGKWIIPFWVTKRGQIYISRSDSDPRPPICIWLYLSLSFQNDWNMGNLEGGNRPFPSQQLLK